MKLKIFFFRYGKGPWILEDYDLELKSGEVVGLSGPSGIGKSTLARILAGYVLPYKGSVRLQGKDLPRKGFNPVQLVFQHPEKAVNPRWQLEKTLNEGWTPDEELLESLGIEKAWLKRWPNELSGGELQRFCVARALSPATRFLIADEMTTMLDAITQAQLWHAVLERAEKNNMAVLVISHDGPLLERLCHRIIDFTRTNH
ncbi:ATP-binding cassette domain-containing protein [Heliorestis acidaminivorans]|uniref:ATP-binding cassette domain-containing protein n=1 Tax=Heliorestis acidaminivorans TaxID=553427 RepID=A0A6I0F1V4_9FIRM|nr:ATP-binding cassette domain-containing protein [Heliorestis acidaminivorans]KAB2953435.1 ATP-binding cassette domain-containing protein [Heliorestis acidaminivorans]